MLRVSHAGTIVGIGFLAVAMTAATYLVIDEMAKTAVAAAVTAVAGAVFLGVWFVLPLSTPYDRWDEDVDEDELEEQGSQPTLGSRAQ
jgi:membrane protein YdbS with pleckstrin-like domain